MEASTSFSFRYDSAFKVRLSLNFKKIMTTIIEPQIQGQPEDCANRQMKLYEAVRERIAQSFFSRVRTDEEELLHVIFMNLVNKYLPPFDSEEMTKLLDDEIANSIREFKRTRKTTFDIDDVDPDEGPAYDMKANADEEEFEAMFERFCESREEPERTIFRRARTHGLREIARYVGISRNEVSRLVKSMPKKFENFIENFRE